MAQMHTIGSHKTKVESDKGLISVTYHETREFEGNKIVLGR